jgi:putative phosphoribosyl transferase
MSVIDSPELFNRTHVFAERRAAGRLLAELVAPAIDETTTVVAVPAGGVPVGIEIAQRWQLPLEAAIVSKITLPWNTEAGYGAVAFDGTVELNEQLVAHLGLARNVIEKGIADTRLKVERRKDRLVSHGLSAVPQIRARTALVVDDGMASGFTLRVGVRALRAAGAQRVVVAVPTAPLDGARSFTSEVDALFVANLRRGASFAVADAYEHWSDLDESEALAELSLRR